MKLIRNGVFETNSSSAHSLAYGTEYILRGSRWYQPTEEHDFSNPMYRLDTVPDHYKGYTFSNGLVSTVGMVSIYAHHKKSFRIC